MGTFFSNQTEDLRGWYEQLLQRKELLSLSLGTDQVHYTIQCHATTLRNWYRIAALFHCWGSFQVCRFARIAISHSLAQLHRGSASRRNITRSTTLAPYNVFVGQKCEILAQCKSHHRGNVASQYLLIMLHFANYLHLYRSSNACNTCRIVGLHFCWTVNDKLGTFLSWRPTPCSHGASHNVLSASVWNCEQPKCLLCAKLCPPSPLVESKWCSFWWKASPRGQYTT